MEITIYRTPEHVAKERIAMAVNVKAQITLTVAPAELSEEARKQLIRSLPPDRTINLEYLSDALKSPMTHFRVHPRGGITLIGTNTEALIMSLKCM